MVQYLAKRTNCDHWKGEDTTKIRTLYYQIIVVKWWLNKCRNLMKNFALGCIRATGKKFSVVLIVLQINTHGRLF